MEIAALVISAVSLFVAIASYVSSSKARHLQNQVNEIELKLKKYELAEKEKEQQKAPRIEARINHFAQNSYVIKVWNSGNDTAKNIKVSWNDDEGIICLERDKMPFEALAPQKSFDLSISTYDGSPNKLLITTTWEDSAGNKHSQDQWCGL